MISMKSTRHPIRIAPLALSLTLGTAALTLADVQVSKVFGNHMVLQPRRPAGLAVHHRLSRNRGPGEDAA